MNNKIRNVVRFVSVGAMIAVTLSACNPPEAGVFGSGTIEATEITVSARTQGEILSVSVDESDRVEAGTILAQVDPEDLELQLEGARQGVAAAEAQLDLILAGARIEDLQHAEAQLAQAQQAFDLAQKNYERVISLYESGSATSSDRDQVETSFEQAQSGVVAAQAQLDRLRNMARPEEIRRARAQLEQANASMRRIQLLLDETTVTAPISGTVTTVAHEAGEYASPGSALFTIADLTNVHLTIYVPETALGKFSLGETARIAVDGRPESQYIGRVTNVADEAEFTPKNVQTQDARAQLVYAVEISIENDEGVFKIGMPADARIVPEGD